MFPVATTLKYIESHPMQNDESQDKWMLAEGDEEGQHLLFRVRQELPAGVLKMNYPELISVFWEFDAEENDGMPDEETSEVHFEFEQAVHPLDAPEYSYLMLVITGGGRKEWHFYARDEAEWIDQLNELLADHPEYPLQIEVSADPEWSLYSNVMDGIAGAS